MAIGSTTRGIEPRKPAGRRRAVAGEEWLTTRPGSPDWHYDFSIEGHRFRGSCRTATFADACRFADDERDREWRRIKLGEKPAVHLTLNEGFTLWWQDRGKGTAYGEAAQRYQLNRILRILGKETRFADLDDPTVARLVRGLRNGEGAAEGQEKRSKASNATVNRYLATLSVVCKWAASTEGAVVGGWTKGPHKLTEPEGIERYFPHEHGRALVSEIIPHARDPIALGLMTGARRKNWLRPNWEDISLDLGRMLIMGKGNPPRIIRIALSKMAVKLLERVQPDPEKRRGPVFVYGLESAACTCAHCVSPLYRGQPIKSLRRSFATAKRLAGLPANVRLHDIRHSFAAWLLHETGNIKVVQEALTHKNIATTMRYAPLMPGVADAAIARATAALAGMFDPPTIESTAEEVPDAQQLPDERKAG